MKIEATKESQVAGLLKFQFILRISLSTRFGPNRVAADMEGNGEFDFMGDL